MKTNSSPTLPLDLIHDIIQDTATPWNSVTLATLRSLALVSQDLLVIARKLLFSQITFKASKPTDNYQNPHIQLPRFVFLLIRPHLCKEVVQIYAENHSTFPLERFGTLISNAFPNLRILKLIGCSNDRQLVDDLQSIFSTLNQLQLFKLTAHGYRPSHPRPAAIPASTMACDLHEARVSCPALMLPYIIAAISHPRTFNSLTRLTWETYDEQLMPAILQYINECHNVEDVNLHCWFLPSAAISALMNASKGF
jgi:hypothetical protein